MALVVVDDPLAPERCQGIHVQHASTPASTHLRRRRRSGIKTDPAIAGKIYFHPRVRVAAPDQILRRKVIELAGAESIHHSRRDAQGTQHDGHRRGEVFAVSLLAFKKEIGYGIARNAARKLQSVSKMRA